MSQIQRPFEPRPSQLPPVRNRSKIYVLVGAGLALATALALFWPNSPKGIEQIKHIVNTDSTPPKQAEEHIAQLDSVVVDTSKRKATAKKVNRPAPSDANSSSQNVVKKNTLQELVQDGTVDNYKLRQEVIVKTNPNEQGKVGGNSQGSRPTISVVRGLTNRQIVRSPKLDEAFNENAKIVIDIKVDTSGSVTDANFQPRGSTTGDVYIRNLALKKAKELKFTPAREQQTGTVIVNIKMKE
jgi:outer membrane biosynthesis protein TonB